MSGDTEIMRKGDTVYKPADGGHEPRGTAMSDPFDSDGCAWIAVEFVTGKPTVLQVAELAVDTEGVDADKTRGVYRKFEVKRTDGSSEKDGKHEHCRYFVLDLDHDPHAVAALEAYAESCEETHPDLSSELAYTAEQLLSSLGEPEPRFYTTLGWKSDHVWADPHPFFTEESGR